MNRAAQIKGYEFGVFQLDTGNRLLLRDGVPVSLSLKSYDLLEVLVESRRNVLEKERLMQLVWPNHFVEEANLSHHIYLLRKALGDDKSGNSYIETIPRRGYRFVMPVTELPDRGTTEPVPKALTNPERALEQSAAPSSLDPILWEAPAFETAAQEIPSASPRSRLRGWGRIWGIVAGLIIMAVLGGYTLWNRAPATPKVSQARIVPLTTLPGQENQPVLSPDASRVAFCWYGEKENNFDIYVKIVGAESQLRLTSHAAQDTSPAWSPDGRFIAFHRNTGKDSGFYVIPALGGPERKIAAAFPARANFRGRTVDWFPDGESLAIVERDSDQEPFHVCVVSIETGAKRRLVSAVPPSTGVMGLAVSPEGNNLAFTAFMDGKPDLPRKHMDLYAVSAEGGTPRRVTSSEGGVVGMTWTPDGRQIIFSPLSIRSGVPGPDVPFNLWKISPRGGEREVLQVPPHYAYLPTNPHVSRAEGRLVFEQREIWSSDIWRGEGPAGAATGMLPSKLIASTAAEQDPQFSPDGKRIAYTSYTSGMLALWVSDLEGQSAVQLTSREFSGLRFVRWSPDASRIAFHSGGDIWTVGSQGGSVRRLTADDSEQTLPSWSMDGQWVYFASDRTGTWQVWRMPSQGGPAIQITRNGGVEAFESIDGKHLYFTKYNGLPWTFGLSSIWRMPAQGGEETQVVPQTSVGYWGLTWEGICYLNAEGDLPFAFEFLHLKNGTKKKFATLDREPLWNFPSFAVSPDGKRVLYTRRPSEERDLMLIENFD